MLWSLLAACTPTPDVPSPPRGTADTAADTATDTAHTAVDPTGDTAHVAPTGDTGAAETLVVASLNLHCFRLDGTSFPTNEARWDAIAAVFAADGVDVVALQEACRRPGEDAAADLALALETHTGSTWTLAWAFAHTAWAGTPEEAEEGVALLSRRGLVDPTELVYADPGALRRVALFASLQDGTAVGTTHLDFNDPSSRLSQARHTASWATSAADHLDVVVAGDLNAEAGTAVHDAFGTWGYTDASASLDPTRIDHVLVHRGARWGVVSAALRFTDVPVSDHPGVLVVLSERPPPAVSITRIVASAAIGGAALSVRGDTAPLSWDRGWWMARSGAGTWRLLATELEGTFKFKTLVDDTTWQTGADITGVSGQQNDVTPTF